VIEFLLRSSSSYVPLCTMRPAVLAGPRADIDDPVSVLDGVLVVLDRRSACFLNPLIGSGFR